MDKIRKINLLTDEEISCILSALNHMRISDKDICDIALVDDLISRFEAGYEVGIINEEKV